MVDADVNSRRQRLPAASRRTGEPLRRLSDPTLLPPHASSVDYLRERVLRHGVDIVLEPSPPLTPGHALAPAVRGVAEGARRIVASEPTTLVFVIAVAFVIVLPAMRALFPIPAMSLVPLASIVAAIVALRMSDAPASVSRRAMIALPVALVFWLPSSSWSMGGPEAPGALSAPLNAGLMSIVVFAVIVNRWTFPSLNRLLAACLGLGTAVALAFVLSWRPGGGVWIASWTQTLELGVTFGACVLTALHFLLRQFSWSAVVAFNLCTAALMLLRVPLAFLLTLLCALVWLLVTRRIKRARGVGAAQILPVYLVAALAATFAARTEFIRYRDGALPDAIAVSVARVELWQDTLLASLRPQALLASPVDLALLVALVSFVVIVLSRIRRAWLAAPAIDHDAIAVFSVLAAFVGSYPLLVGGPAFASGTALLTAFPIIVHRSLAKSRRRH